MLEGPGGQVLWRPASWADGRLHTFLSPLVQLLCVLLAAGVGGCLKTRGRPHSPGVRSETLRSHKKCEGIGRSCGWAPGAGTAARPQHGLRAVLVTLEQLQGSDFFLGGETCDISRPRPRLRRPLAAGSGHCSIPHGRGAGVPSQGGETPPQTPAAANRGQGSRRQDLRHVTE